MRIVIRDQADRCQDCDLRHALDFAGRPRKSRLYGYRLTHGCEGCGGSGREGRKAILDAEKALGALTEKQRFVIERRYGYPDGKKHTQREIADAMGVSQGAVSQIEKAAKARLSNLMGKTL